MGIVCHSPIDVTFPRQQDLPLDGYYHVKADGEIVTPRRAEAWPNNGAGKIGDGLGRDGYGADGFGDGGAGVGLGLDGFGPDGFGTPAATIRTAKLADGTYDAEIVGYDAAGNASTGNLTAEVTLAGTPGSPGWPEPTDYDDGTDDLTLTLSELSSDDEG